MRLVERPTQVEQDDLGARADIRILSFSAQNRIQSSAAKVHHGCARAV